MKDSGIPALVVGSILPARKARGSLTLASTLATTPTLHEFGVIVLRYVNETLLETPREKWEEWRAFLRGGGVAILIGVDQSIQRYAEKLIGHGLPRLVEQEGETVRWVRGAHLCESLGQGMSYHWSAAVPRAEIGPCPVLGRNGAGDVVAFEVRSDRGWVLFIPALGPSGRDQLVLSVIESARRHVAMSREQREAPPWIAELALASERRLQAEREVLSNKLRLLTAAKRILYEDGGILSRECSRVLSEMLAPSGVTIAYKEDEGAHDIEMVGGTATTLIEVRGSTGPVEVGVVRQLAAHLKSFSAATAEVRGCIVANPHRLKPPADRIPPFTAHCKTESEANRYCLLTTVQLLDIYDRFLQGAFTSAQFVALLSCTVGPLQADSPSWARQT